MMQTTKVVCTYDTGYDVYFKFYTFVLKKGCGPEKKIGWRRVVKSEYFPILNPYLPILIIFYTSFNKNKPCFQESPDPAPPEKNVMWN